MADFGAPSTAKMAADGQRDLTVGDLVKALEGVYPGALVELWDARYEMWVCATDVVIRHSHSLADGQTVEVRVR